MKIKEIQAAAKANFSRFNPANTKGFYESYFVRANHPIEKQAFWIRYTLFAPKDQPHQRMGELWAVFFDGKEISSFKEEFPFQECSFPNKNFLVELADNSINSAKAIGKAGKMKWELHYQSNEPPLYLLPLPFYPAPFPKAKSIVSLPFAAFDGWIKLGRKKINIQNWIGSQNHNWGEKHTDYYAWGQVAGFDNSPDTFLEVITAKLELGKVETPFLTILVLRHKGKDYNLNNFTQWFLNKGSFKCFEWEFDCMNETVHIKGKITAPANAFTGLRYQNPPGGNKNCLNSKLASCQLEITEKGQRGMPQSLYSDHKCAFEILTNQDEENHGIKINF